MKTRSDEEAHAAADVLDFIERHRVRVQPVLDARRGVLDWRAAVTAIAADGYRNITSDRYKGAGQTPAAAVRAVMDLVYREGARRRGKARKGDS